MAARRRRVLWRSDGFDLPLEALRIAVRWTPEHQADRGTWNACRTRPGLRWVGAEAPDDSPDTGHADGWAFLFEYETGEGLVGGEVRIGAAVVTVAARPLDPVPRLARTSLGLYGLLGDLSAALDEKADWLALLGETLPGPEADLQQPLRFAALLHDHMVLKNPRYSRDPSFSQAMTDPDQAPRLAEALAYASERFPDSRISARLQAFHAALARDPADPAADPAAVRRAAGRFRREAARFADSREVLGCLHDLLWTARKVLSVHEEAAPSASEASASASEVSASASASTSTASGPSELDRLAPLLVALGYEPAALGFRRVERRKVRFLHPLVSDEERLLGVRIGTASRKGLAGLPESEWSVYDCDPEQEKAGVKQATTNILWNPYPAGTDPAPFAAALSRALRHRPLPAGYRKAAAASGQGQRLPVLSMVVTWLLSSLFMGAAFYIILYLLVFGALILALSLAFSDPGLMHFMYGPDMLIFMGAVCLGVTALVLAIPIFLGPFFSTAPNPVLPTPDVAPDSPPGTGPVAPSDSLADDATTSAGTRPDAVAAVPESPWRAYPLRESLRERLLHPTTPYHVEVEEDEETGGVRMVTTPAAWGDVALVFPEARVAGFRLPLSLALEHGELDGDDIRLYFRMGSGGPLLLRLGTRGLLARARFFRYSHPHRQDASYAAADAEELVEKEHDFGPDALWPEEKAALPLARLLLLMETGLLENPDWARKNRVRELEAKQKAAGKAAASQAQGTSNEPADGSANGSADGSAPTQEPAQAQAHDPSTAPPDPSGSQDPSDASEPPAFAVRWMRAMDRDSLQAWMHEAAAWLRAEGDDRPLADALVRAAEIMELPGETFRSLVNPHPAARETRAQRKAREAARWLWQQHRSRPPNRRDLFDALCAAFQRLHALRPARPDEPWRKDLEARLDAAMRDRGFDGRYPEYARTVGTFRKWVFFHEQLDTGDEGSTLSVSFRMRYGDAKRRRWVHSGDLELLSATVHPLANRLPDLPDLDRALDASARILEGSTLSKEDREWLESQRGQRADMARGAGCLAVPTAVVLSFLGVLAHVALNMSASAGGSETVPLDLNRVLAIVTAALLVGFGFWYLVIAAQRISRVPVRRLGRKR